MEGTTMSQDPEMERIVQSRIAPTKKNNRENVIYFSCIGIACGVGRYFMTSPHNIKAAVVVGLVEATIGTLYGHIRESGRSGF